VVTALNLGLVSGEFGIWTTRDGTMPFRQGRSLRSVPLRKGHSTNRKHALIGGQPDQLLQWWLVSFCSDARKNGIIDPVAIAVTASWA